MVETRSRRNAASALLVVIALCCAVFACSFAGTTYAVADEGAQSGIAAAKVADIGAGGNLSMQSDAQTVYIAKSRTGIYHFDSTCSRMRNPDAVTLAEAVAMGYRPCEKCATGSVSSALHESTEAASADTAVAAATTAEAVVAAASEAKEFAENLDLPEGQKAMYRLYNPNSGEHFYTTTASECNHLANVGWNYEGVGWIAPETSDDPVYRLYNTNAGDHHYTMSADERDWLVGLGWSYEGIGWYSAAEDEGKPLFRQYNPNAQAGSHNYTVTAGERDWLVSLGWNDEGIGWYGIDEEKVAKKAAAEAEAAAKAAAEAASQLVPADTATLAKG